MRVLLAALFLSALLSVVAEARDDWFEARSPHFTAISNGRDGRAKAILEDLEELRRLMSEIFPSQRVDGTKPAVFYLFKNEKSMEPFQPIFDGERAEWAGMFRPTPLRDVVLVRADGSSESARGMAFIQFSHLVASYNESGYPLWLSNGLSRFYGNAEISDKRASIGKMRDDYRRVLGEFRSMPIRELFAVDHASEHYRNPSKRELFDAQSWALVHYLLIGRARDGGAARLGRYLQRIGQGRQPLLAFQEAMGATLDEIDADVALYIRKSISQYLQVQLPPRERGDEIAIAITELDERTVSAHLGRLYAATRHEEPAEATLRRSIEADPGQVTAYEAMANLREMQGRGDESLDFLEKAVGNGSANPHAHLRYAQNFVRRHDGSRSVLEGDGAAPVVESLRFVLREAPELTDAARLFGFLALFRDALVGEAFETVTAALARKRGDASLMFVLGQLHAKKGSHAAARTLFRRLLARDLEPGFLASVRRQHDFVDAQIELEARRRAAAARAAGTAPPTPVDEAPAQSEVNVRRSPAGEPVVAAKIERVRGALVRFDCTGELRFIVAAGAVVYSLTVVDLAGVEILENGENTGPRDFYCGPLGDHVVARYIPEPDPDPEAQAGSERRGRLVSLDFVGGN